MSFNFLIASFSLETLSPGNLLSQLRLASDPPTSALGVIKGGGAFSDGDSTYIYHGRTLNESFRLCMIDDNNCFFKASDDLFGSAPMDGEAACWHCGTMNNTSVYLCTNDRCKKKLWEKCDLGACGCQGR